MIELLHHKRSAREARKSRQQEVERCLAAFGVLGGSRRRFHRPRMAGREDTSFHRLRQALEQLGPVFSAFGRYMASRVDLLLLRDCLELAAIADWAEATPITRVRELIATEIGRPCDEVYAVFEDTPCESRLLFQTHRARLHDGQAVTVKVVHPELQRYLESDLELLSILEPIFPGTAPHRAAIKDAIVDFRRILQWQIDLLSGVKAFDKLARDAQEFEMLRVPRVYTELCSSQMSTTEHLLGTTLEDILTAGEGTEGMRDLPTPAVFADLGVAPQTLAHRLCMVWLRQVFWGEQFPVEVRPADIVVLPSKQIALTEGVFATLPSDAKRHLWHYVMSTSAEDPDKACTYLLRETMREGQSVDEDELRYRFREVVPFRDGGWSGSEDSNSLVEHLFVHWKLLSERGLRPQPHLLCFYRGLFRMLGCVRRFATGSDAFQEGLQAVRTIALLTQFQEMLELRQMPDTLDKYLAMMMGLPKTFDDALTLVAESRGRLPPQGTRVAPHHTPYNASAVVIALLLVLGAVVLLSHHLAASGVDRVWVDRVSTVVFVGLGALLLRAVSHTR